MNIIYLVLNPKVKEIEKRDSVLTGPQQIDRLTRPGSTYFNLNPYEVDMILLGSIKVCSDLRDQRIEATLSSVVLTNHC